MSAHKQKVSNAIMLLILLFMSIRQFFLFLDIEVIRASSVSSDLSLLLTIVGLAIVLSLLVLFLPVLCVVKLHYSFPVVDISFPLPQSKYVTFGRIQNNQKTYQLCSTIRC